MRRTTTGGREGGREEKREGLLAYLPVFLGHAAGGKDLLGGDELVVSGVFGGGGEEVAGWRGREGGREAGRAEVSC